MENLTSEKIGNVIILGLVAGLWWVNTFINFNWFSFIVISFMLALQCNNVYTNFKKK
jgi:hypothetical protein